MKYGKFCPLCKLGDQIILKEFYIDSKRSKNICINLLSAAPALLSPLIYDASAVELVIDDIEDAVYLQYPV